MKKKIRIIAALAAGFMIAVSITACSRLDVVGKDSVRAFGKVMEAFPVEEYEQNRWRLTAPDGTAWFAFDNMSVDIVVDAAPFVAAGADLSKLDNADKSNLFFSSPAFDMLNQNVKDTPLMQFEYDISCLRKYIGYHSAMDHYNLSFDYGNMFEWAKDLSKSTVTGENQEKDIVFVLNPKPLIAAGVDPEKVEGWMYAQIEVEENGKTEQVWKFLKPFNLK